MQQLNRRGRQNVQRIRSCYDKNNYIFTLLGKISVRVSSKKKDFSYIIYCKTYNKTLYVTKLIKQS